jgi:hypothetical protein
MRGETVRLISARRSRKKEIREYENQRESKKQLKNSTGALMRAKTFLILPILSR